MASITLNPLCLHNTSVTTKITTTTTNQPTSESQCKGSNIPSLESPVVDEEEMRPGHCLGSILTDTLQFLTLVTGRICGTLKPVPLIRKGEQVLLLLLFWHAPLGVRSATYRHFTEDDSGPGRLLRSVGDRRLSDLAGRCSAT